MRRLPEDLSNVEFETSEDVEVISTFDQMGLREDLLRGIYGYGEHQRITTQYFDKMLQFTHFMNAAQIIY